MGFLLLKRSSRSSSSFFLLFFLRFCSVDCMLDHSKLRLFTELVVLVKVVHVALETCGGCFELRCVNHIHWCLSGSLSVIVTATDFCAPNYGLPDDYGGWCNFPRAHFEMSEAAFVQIAKGRADIVRRVKCERNGGMRFTVTGSSYFHQVLWGGTGGRIGNAMPISGASHCPSK